MNIYIYASSRGKSLDMGDIFVKAKPGDKLMTLYELAKRHLMHINGTKLVYFVCGLPDICTLSRKEYPLYEESHIDMTSSECNLLKWSNDWSWKWIETIKLQGYICNCYYHEFLKVESALVDDSK